MNKLSLIALIMLLASSAGRIDSVSAAETNVTQEVDWKVFSKNIEKALLSDNKGVHQSAIGLVIRYGNKINIGQGALEILHTYRSDADLQTRRLALTALPHTGSVLVMGYLNRAVEFEKSPVLKRQIEFILAEKKKK